MADDAWVHHGARTYSLGRRSESRSLLHGGIPGVVVGGVEGDVVFVAGGFASGDDGLGVRADWMAELPGSAFDNALNFLGDDDGLRRVSELAAK